VQVAGLGGGSIRRKYAPGLWVIVVATNHYLLFSFALASLNDILQPIVRSQEQVPPSPVS
jgi:hypothetical protein